MILADNDEMGLRTFVFTEERVWSESESRCPLDNGADFYSFYFLFGYMKTLFRMMVARDEAAR